MNLRSCPTTILLQKIVRVENLPADKADLVNSIKTFLSKWDIMLNNDVLEVANSVLLDDLIVDYDKYFKELVKVRKDIKKLGVVLSPIVIKKSASIRPGLLHRNACMSALRVIIMSTLGGGAKSKYEYEGAKIKAVLRTATGCADEESCAKVSIAVVQNTANNSSISCSNAYNMLEDLIVNELNAAIEMSDLSASDTSYNRNSLEHAEIEMRVFEILNLILSLLPNAPAKNIVLRQSVIKSLFAYLEKGSFPIRRCIYRIIRSSFCDDKFHETLLGMTKNEYVNKLLRKVGNFYLNKKHNNIYDADAAKMDAKGNGGVAVMGTGDFSTSVCCEEVCLLRTLQRNKFWSEIFNQEINFAFKENAPMELVAGVFALLGGHFETIRVGGRVRLISHENSDLSSGSSTSGLVVYVSKTNGTALVAFNVSVDLIPENVEIQDLISVDEVSPQTEIENGNYNDFVKCINRFVNNDNCEKNESYANKMLKCMAVKCFQHLVQTVVTFNASLGLFPAFLDNASKQMNLNSFVERHFLEARGVFLRNRYIESNIGNGSLYERLKADEAETKKVDKRVEMRRAEAKKLMQIAQRPMDICIVALELNGDNQNFALSWLFEKADEFVASGGLNKKKDEQKNPRAEKAITLVQMTQFPSWLCEKALELSDNNAERAYEWLTAGEENGNRYMKLYKQNELKSAKDGKKKRNNFDDSAAIDDMVENEAPIADSSSQGAAVDKKSAQIEERRRRGPHKITLKKFATNERFIVPGSLVTVDCVGGKSDVLKGKTGVVVGDGIPKGGSRKLDVKFLVPNKLQTYIKRIPVSKLLWHDKVYGLPLRSKKDVKSALLSTLDSLTTHYCRDAVVQMLCNSGNDLNLGEMKINAETISMLVKVREDFLNRGAMDEYDEDNESKEIDGLGKDADAGLNARSEEEMKTTTKGTKSRFVPNAEHLAMLTAMGFLEDQAKYALRAAENDMQRAATFLMDPSSLPDLPPEEEEQEETTVQESTTSTTASVIADQVVSPVDAMNDLLFGNGGQQQQSATTVAVVQGENEASGSDDDDDEAEALAMALAMSVDLNASNVEHATDDEQKTGDTSTKVEESGNAKKKGDERLNDKDGVRQASALSDLIDAVKANSSAEAGASCSIIQLVKLLASNSYSFKNTKIDPSSLVGKLRNLLAKVLRAEVQKNNCNKEKPLSRLLVEECITHLIQSTQQGKKVTKAFESLHPYYQQSDYGGSIGFPEARALRVTFHPQCATPSRDVGALTFYSDENCTHQIASFSGKTGWRPFIVEAGKVYFKFLSRANELDCWGYKFEVAPISGLQWVNEKEVFAEASLEWACYVLDFLLKEGLELGIGAAVHKPQIFDALVQYLCFPGVPYKRKVVSLLLQLLQSPELFPKGGRPDLDSLKGVGSLVVQRCKATNNFNVAMAPSALQALVELEATRRKVVKYYAEIDNQKIDATVKLSKDDKGTVKNQSKGNNVKGFSSDLTKLEPQFVVKPVVQRKLKDSDAPDGMLDLMELMQTFHSGGRFSDEFYSEALLHSMLTKVVESDHPHKTGTSSGEMKFPGAIKLEIVYDTRCKLPSGSTFELQCRKLVKKADGSNTGAWRKVNSNYKDNVKQIVETDMIKWKISSNTKPSDARWGIRMLIHAIEVDETRIKDKREFFDKNEIEKNLIDLTTKWDQRSDLRLTQWINSATNNMSYPPSVVGSLYLAPQNIELSKNELVRLTELNLRSKKQLSLRYCLLRSFNRRLNSLLNLVDLSRAEFPWSIASKVRESSYMIFADVKNKFLQMALHATCFRVMRPPSRRRHRSEIVVDRIGAAAKSKAQGLTEPLRSNGVFVQMYKGLKDWHPAYLRRAGQSFRVKFLSERGVDAGGLYRECMNEAVEELFSPHLSLFLKTPNTLNEGGIGYVPNAKCSTPSHLKMYEFVGKLIGMSLRSDACLAFEFPSLLWKMLIGNKASKDDLKSIDTAGMQALERLRNDTLIEEADLRFVIKNTSGEEIELVRYGRSVRVDAANRGKYCDLSEEYKLHEFDAQIQAIRRGFITIVPERVLGLMLWSELEELVVGSSEIDIGVLKAHTTYGSRSFERSVTVKHFWTVLESFTNEERAMFVRFAWGRSRLPRSGQWDNNFTLMRCGVDPNRLPVAHTCFFQLDLPPYRTEDELRERLLMAINDGAGVMGLA